MNLPAALQSQIKTSRIVAVLVIDSAADAIPLARALLAGGIAAMELTLRTPAALESLRRIRAEVPEMLAGAGTVLNPDQARQVFEAGAAFAVAPGLNPRVVAAARELGLPFAPGIATPSDIEGALELGCNWLKFFPASTLGGLKHLKNMAAPYLHLGVQFIPLGGITVDNMGEYLADPLIPAVGGSWLAPRDTIKAGNFTAITALAQAAVKRGQPNVS